MTTDGKVLNLPPPPVGLTTPCKHPVLKEGDDFRSALNKSTAGLTKCEDKRRGWETFYGDVQKKYKPLG